MLIIYFSNKLSFICSFAVFCSHFLKHMLYWICIYYKFLFFWSLISLQLTHSRGLSYFVCLVKLFDSLIAIIKPATIAKIASAFPISATIEKAVKKLFVYPFEKTCVQATAMLPLIACKNTKRIPFRLLSVWFSSVLATKSARINNPSWKMKEPSVSTASAMHTTSNSKVTTTENTSAFLLKISSLSSLSESDTKFTANSLPVWRISSVFLRVVLNLSLREFLSLSTSLLSGSKWTDASETGTLALFLSWCAGYKFTAIFSSALWSGV